MRWLAEVLTMPPQFQEPMRPLLPNAHGLRGSRMASKASLRRLMFAARQWFGFWDRNSKLHARKLPGLTQTLVGTTAFYLQRSSQVFLYARTFRRAPSSLGARF